MLQYNTDKLDGVLFHQALSKWIKQQWITSSPAQSGYIGSRLSYTKYDWLKRLGLYIVTLIAAQSSVGFVMLFVFQVFQVDPEVKVIAGFTAVAGIALLFLLNKFIKQNNVYKQGTDDALLHSALGYIYCGLILVLGIDISAYTGILFGAISLLCLTGFAGYQYSDSFVAAICLITFNFIPLYIVSLITNELLFFSVLLIVPLNLLVIRTINKYNTLENHYWHGCFVVGKVVACVMMYVSVNLYVIRSLAYELMGAESIPLQPLFLGLTIATPLVFITMGIRKKLRYLLYCGLGLLLPTVATVRYYYSVMPVELACLLGGLILIISCYVAIRYLRNNESSYTFEADSDENLSSAEMLLILQQFGKPGEQPATTTDTQLNGGSFGGAGSGGDF